MDFSELKRIIESAEHAQELISSHRSFLSEEDFSAYQQAAQNLIRAIAEVESPIYEYHQALQDNVLSSIHEILEETDRNLDGE